MTHNPFDSHGWASHQSQPPVPQDDPRKIAEGWLGNAPVADGGRQAAERVRAYRPTVGKKILAWISVGMGVVMVLPLTTEATGLWDALSTALLGLMFALPGVYWLVRNRGDQRTIAEWAHRVEDQRQMRRFLSGPELSMFDSPEPTPLLPKRRWGRVVLVEIVLFVFFTIAANLAL